MSTVRAVLFDAGHTLLELDYAAFTARIRASGYDVYEGTVTDAERRARAARRRARG
jgi:FMN phosphatase YigB (HAD superfamily)